ncbi:MAG: hypothetical protein KDD62_08335 [Bdellovibrionales bacterium]|nr:hypothetical protein [Bdellovibrionales bacterium]
MSKQGFYTIAIDLEHAGLIWQPEIGDEVARREMPEDTAILVDPMGMGPRDLRQVFVWLPTIEQLVMQLESRQAILFHAGLELSEAAMQYKAVIQSPNGSIEVMASDLRAAVGISLRDLLLLESDSVH